MKGRKIVLIVSLVVIFGLSFGGYYTYKFLSNGFNQKISGRKDSKSVSTVSFKEGPKIVQPFNLLILGIDDGLGRDWQGRSDTILLMRLLPEEKKIHTLSIPRDTLSEIPGHGQDKINHAYAFGGSELSIKSIEKLTGQNVDYYFQIDMDGFTKLVDEIGGVDFNLDRKIPYKSGYLNPGLQHFDGEKALAVVRFRHEPLGDIARVKRQMKFIKAVIDQAIGKSENVDKIIVLRKIEDNIQTDMDLKDLIALINTFKNIKGNQIVADVVPGDFYNYKKISYWKPDRVELSNTIQKLFS